MGGNNTTTQTQAPWGPAQPAYQQMINWAQGLYGQQKGQPGAGIDPSQLAALQGIIGKAGGPNPLTGQIPGILNQFGDVTNRTNSLLDQLRGRGDQIGTGGFQNELRNLQGPTAADRYLTDMAAGRTGANDPYFQEALNAQTDQATNSLLDRYAAAGRSFSGAEATDYARTIGGIRAGALSDQYNANLQRQLAASGQLDAANLAQSGARTGILGNIAGIQGQNIGNIMQRQGMTLQGLNQQTGNQATLAGILPGLQNLRYDDLTRMLQAGGMRQGLNQGQLNAPWDLINKFSGVLGSIPGGQQTTTPPANSGWINALGGISSILGLFGGLMSDKRVKTDIERVGKTEGGTPVYTYKYKDWEEGPTFMGVLAQEAKRRNPDAVRKGPGGILEVDYARIA